MLVTICLAIIFVSLVVLHLLMQYNKAGRMINKIPGPTPLPFIGNVLIFNVSLEKIWTTMIDLNNKYHPIFRLWKGWGHGVFIADPDDMKAILTCKKNINKSQIVYDGVRKINNHGLITGGGEKWQQRRKMISPAFNQNLMKVYTEIFNEHTVQLIKDLKNRDAEIIPDILHIFYKFILGIICETTMGVDPKIFGDEMEKEFRESFLIVNETTYYRVSKPYIQDWMLKFLSVGRRYERAIKKLRDFTNKVIQERREYHDKVGYKEFENMADDSKDIIFKNKKKRLYVLDILLVAERDKLIDEWGVMEEAETFLLAGSETCASIIPFALLLLAENKVAQDLARVEITELLKETDGELTVTDVNKLEYLDRCIKETLRLYPSAPFAGRSITHDIKLSNYDIPLETDVIMQFYALHRDSIIWPNPKKFDPDRFLPENIQERHPFAFLPFSAGPRSCIGQKFAMLQLKIVIGRILHNFFLEPIISAEDVIIKSHVTLRPVGPVPIKLIKINHDISM